MRGATFIRTIPALVYDISIHTPHAGSDEYSPLGLLRTVGFQSTLPMRGATGVL